MAEMSDRCRFDSIPFRWIYVTGILLVLFCGIQETLSARGARIGGGFRSSSSRYTVRTSSNVRYVSSTRVRVRYNNNYRPWRSWHSYGSSGYIYGYVYYTRSRHYHSHRDREPTICRNEYDNLMDNGTHYEWFICPNMTSPDNYDACCGDEDRQHCCQSGSNGLRVFGIVVGAFILLFGFVVIVYCCCLRKASGRETYFRQRFMSKHLANPAHPPSAAVHYRPDATGKSGNASEITHLMNPPMQGPQPTFPQNEQPGYPPSIQTTYPPQPLPDASGYAHSGYPPSGGPGASCAPPYSPYPGASPYPPASDQPLYPVQPPLGDGSGYVSSVSAPPYPPYPTDGSSAPPYPPYPAGGSSAPPYPPYPTDGSSTPCPPYPADGGAAPPYPPQPAAYNPPGYPGNPPPTYSNLK